MKFLISLWKFSRPHTITGTVISIFTLYMMACNSGNSINPSEHIILLILALITGISCNIFIVGINQIEDIELDKINKPQLPLASGELSRDAAVKIIWTCLFIASAISLYISVYLFLVVGFSMLTGWAYSCPPLYLRRHHLPAAIAIATVRGLMVNLGAYLTFTRQMHGVYSFGDDILILSIFTLAFSIAIAWFKDLPDMQGDAAFRIRSLALIYSPRLTIYAGNILVISAYVFSIYYYNFVSENNSVNTIALISYGHFTLMMLFLANSIFSAKKTQNELRKYYKRFWLFFFAEYILYLLINLF